MLAPTASVNGREADEEGRGQEERRREQGTEETGGEGEKRAERERVREGDEERKYSIHKQALGFFDLIV